MLFQLINKQGLLVLVLGLLAHLVRREQRVEAVPSRSLRVLSGSAGQISVGIILVTAGPAGSDVTVETPLHPLILRLYGCTGRL